MKNYRQMLCIIASTIHLGMLGIRSCLRISMRPGLRMALESQLREYTTLEAETHALASRRGWDIPETEPIVRIARKLSLRIRLRRKISDSRIADIMILRGTKDMIRLIQDMNQFSHGDEPIRILAQKLLDCENAGIRQMQRFL